MVDRRWRGNGWREARSTFRPYVLGALGTRPMCAGSCVRREPPRRSPGSHRTASARPPRRTSTRRHCQLAVWPAGCAPSGTRTPNPLKLVALFDGPTASISICRVTCAFVARAPVVGLLDLAGLGTDGGGVNRGHDLPTAGGLARRPLVPIPRVVAPTWPEVGGSRVELARSRSDAKHLEAPDRGQVVKGQSAGIARSRGVERRRRSSLRSPPHRWSGPHHLLHRPRRDCRHRNLGATYEVAASCEGWVLVSMPSYSAPHAAPPRPPLALYRPDRVAQQLAIGAACAVTVALVASAIAAFPAADDPALTGEGPPSQAVTTYVVIFLIFLLAQLAAYFVTCAWLHLVRRNAEVLDPTQRHRHSVGWVWASWLVPIVSLWFPYQVVADVRGATSPSSRSGVWLLRQWWAAWLLLWITSNITSTVFPMAGASDGTWASWEAPLQALAALFSVAALVAWIRIIREISNTQARSAAAQGWSPALALGGPTMVGAAAATGSPGSGDPWPETVTSPLPVDTPPTDTPGWAPAVPGAPPPSQPVPYPEPPAPYAEAPCAVRQGAGGALPRGAWPRRAWQRERVVGTTGLDGDGRVGVRAGGTAAVHHLGGSDRSGRGCAATSERRLAAGARARHRGVGHLFRVDHPWLRAGHRGYDPP